MPLANTSNACNKLFAAKQAKKTWQTNTILHKSLNA